MKILGFNPGHHGSVCLLEDGELKFFIQEERIGNRKKYATYPFRSFINILQGFTIIDYITWGCPSNTFFLSKLHQSSYWSVIANKFHPKIEPVDFSPQQHHSCHTAHSFYNSGFKSAIGITIDGLGSQIFDKEGNKIGQETETISINSYPNKSRILYKNFRSNKLQNINLSQLYETITIYLGWDRNEAGKTMGLSSYGKYNSNLPDFIKKNEGNKEVFYPIQDSPTDKVQINTKSYPQLELKTNPKEWHYNKSKITDLEKDIAWKIQNDTQQLVGDYIEKAIKETGLKQVCCAGGYFLNCVTNYYLLKRFPGVEFYFEPIANDAGTAIGAAKLLWHGITQDTTIRPFKSLYLGKQYSKEELLEGIKKYT
tara:strand:- start:1436 stop:2542 length:1107 start_codon:yes stop_codon:yes gene_type:complete